MKCRAVYCLSKLCLLAALAAGLADGPSGWARRVRADEPQAATAEKRENEKPTAKASAPSAEDEEEPPLDAPPRKSPPAAKQPAETTPKESDAPADPGAPAKPKAPTEQGPAEDEPPLEPGGPVCDIIYSLDRTGKERSFRAALYPDWLEFPVPRNQTFTFHYYNRLGASGSSEAIAGAQLKRIDYYELRMMGLAAEQLNLDARRLTEPGAAVDLSQLAPERIEQAEKLLVTAAAQHESAVQQNRRRGAAWASHVRQPLADALFNLRLGEIDRLITDRQDQEARALCDRTHAELREPQGARRAALRGRYETILLVPAEAAIERRDFKTARDLLDSFRDRYPRESGEATDRVNQRLKAESKSLLQEAQRLAEADRSQALKLVELAGLASPELPEIDDLRRQLGLAYPTLECAYAELPRNFAPPQALTPVERHASALLFESLICWTDDPRTGPHYAAQLAEGEPLALARGRQFRLPRTPPAKWSDYSDEQPHFCTSADVNWTIKLLQDKGRPGYSSALARLIGGGETDAAEDPFTAVIRLKRDYWQPLSLMGFPIVPRHCFPAGGSKEELAAFNAAPVGSGPYRLGERTDRRVQFVAQAHERAAGRPKIREINFRRFAAEEMVGEILSGRVQLAYGLTAKQVDQLTEQRRQVKKLRPRGVWFLAPNYRRAAMKNQQLRLALAHAIDRRSILDKVFRPQGRGDDHAELSGPFPRSSWASDGDAPAFDVEQARAFALNAQRELGQLAPLKLVYASDDADAESACRQIQAQAAAVEIAIVPEAASPDDFADRILRRHDFDLAYWRHDYADETYELWPLFDPDPAAQAAGGANFMGAVPDASLAGFFRELALHKRYADIRALMHKIHDHVARTAAIIPLWQLDVYVAVDDSLQGIALDPDVLFGDVRQWELRTR